MRRFAAMVPMLLCSAVMYAQQSASFLPEIARLEKRGYQQQRTPPNGGFSLASGNFSVYYYCLRWNINPAERFISGAVTSYFTMLSPGSQLVYDLDNSLVVDSVYFRNTAVTFLQNTNKTLRINFGTTLSTNSKDSLTIYYHGTPANNGSGSFIQTTHNGNMPVVWTLSQPYGARDWWPCRNGLDDKADSIDIYITHPNAYSASANGMLINTTNNGNNCTSFFKHCYPIATYLVGIAVTNYVQFSKVLTLHTGTLPVTTTVFPESLHYFQNNIQPVYDALQLYDQYFGTYPFIKERYGQTQFSWGGGMEHQTNSFIVSADEYLMAHELAHQWFGDKITCASWQDVWLNEGFATWMADMFYTEHLHPERLPAMIAEDLAAIYTVPHGSVWVEDTTNIDRIFDNALSYKKGAFLLRMLRRTIGDTAFFESLRQYQQDTALQYGFARTANLQRIMEKVSGKDLAYFFNQWLYGKGFPAINVNWAYSNGKVQAIINQTTADSAVKFFKIPLDLLFKKGTQEHMVTVDLVKNNQRFTLPVSFEPDTVLIDPAQYFITYNNTSAKVNSLPATLPLTLLLYPNPAHDLLQVRTNSDEIKAFNIQVFNAAGVQVGQQSVMLNSDATFTLPVAKLSAGLYFLRVDNGEGKLTTQKFIKY